MASPLPAPPPLTTASSIFVDEEDVLGFKVWVAELELVVGSVRGKERPDARAALELLHKLVSTLGRTPGAEVREYQRRCEDALVDVLLKGAPPPVRGTACRDLEALPCPALGC